MIGQTISHYKILEKLGEGGMGVVYKAQDTKLDRLVALKFLPLHLTANEAEKARFLQEARAASSLNHPNVCTIYGIEEHEDPAGAGKQQFIEMEFVEGVTLRQKFSDSPLNVNDALSYTVQIGEALQEAHSKGIVHRDIKSDNIMINTKNLVKVMDFGLAKLKGSLKLTRTSSTVGTLAYMAPEQIQGGDVDARSDVFSFGVVLFEMLTGRIPFRGEHEAAMVYSIVNEEPEPLLKYRPEVSPDLQRIINRALEKEPEDRYQSVADMVSELRRLQKQSTRVSRKSLGEMRVPQVDLGGKMPEPSARRISRKTMIGIGLGALIVVVGVVALLFLKPTSRISENLVFKPLQVPFTAIWYPGLSADGNWIAFPAMDENNVTEIYYMHASGGEPKRLTNDSLFKFTADISPDGSQILYTRWKSRGLGFFPLQLLTISTLGGSSKKLVDSTNANRWSSDGKSIAYVGLGPLGRGPALWIMNADGSNKHLVFEDTEGGGRGTRLSMAWSPDSKSIAWLRNFAGEAGRYQEIIIRALESGRERQITHDRKNIDEVYWMPQGEILFSSNRNGPSNLWAIPSDGGTPLQITKGPGPDMGIKASRDGTRVLYLQQAESGAIFVADPQGLNARQITPDDQSVSNPQFSPDGHQIGFLAGDQDPLKSVFYLFVVDRQGQNRRQLTTTGRYIFNLVWSTDSRKIAYSFFDGSEVVRNDSTMKVAIVDVADPAQTSVVARGFVIGWGKDGLSLNVVRFGTSWGAPLAGGDEKKMYEDSTVVLASPNGLALAISDSRTASKGLWVRTRNRSPKKLLDEPAFYAWVPDSKYIVFPKAGLPWMVSVETGKTQRVPWKNEVAFPSDLSTDGKQSLFVKPRMNAKLILIDNFH